MALCAACMHLGAQVTVEASMDSVAILVGEQARLRLTVSAPATKTISLPDLKPGALLTQDMEIVGQSPTDTTTLNEGKTVQIGRTYTITSFADHDTLCRLPPLTIMVDSQEYRSKALALKVFTMDVDTLHADQFFGSRGIDEPELTWADVRSAVYMSAAIVLLAVVLILLIRRYRHGKPIINLQRRIKRRPPHQVALEEINRIRDERKWADEDSKEYYTLLTDALRRYMSERYGFSAMEMTSYEIIDRLLTLDDVMLDELRSLFTTADLVKFAKASTLIGENDMNLVNAIAYIQQTKQETDPNAPAQPEPVTTEEKEHMMQRRIMLVIMTAAALSIVTLAVLLTIRIADLMP